jgi:hypothetical protein
MLAMNYIDRLMPDKPAQVDDHSRMNISAYITWKDAQPFFLSFPGEPASRDDGEPQTMATLSQSGGLDKRVHFQSAPGAGEACVENVEHRYRMYPIRLCSKSSARKEDIVLTFFS